jgi:hypothetical protein
VYALHSGSLPSGLELDTATGEISGKATAVESQTFTIRVTDGLGTTADQSYTIEVVNEPAILPDVLVKGWTTKAYSTELDINAIGVLDPDYVTIYDSCRLGTWTVEFTSATDYTISGPGVSGVAGDIETDLTIPGMMQIEAAAWGGTILTGYVMTFKTCISWENVNPVDALYAIVSRNVPTNLIDASSFFAAKYLGTLSDAVDSGDMVIKIAVSVPVILSSGTLIITEGATTEEVAITVGNDDEHGYPPEITFSVAALTNSYTTAAVVEWKKRTSAFTTSRYSFDNEWKYCDDNSIIFSLSADREMSIAQAIEVISAHIDGFIFQDNWGVEHAHSIRESVGEAAFELNDSNCILAPGAEIENLEIVNEIVCKYGYDYQNNRYLGTFIHPESDAENKSLWRHTTKKTVELLLPGFYDESFALTIAERKFLTREDGLRTYVFSASLSGFLLRIGERYAFSSPRIGSTRQIEIIGLRAGQFVNDISLKFVAYDRTKFIEAS